MLKFIKIFSLLITLLLITNTNPSFASQDTDDGGESHGGDPITQEFKSMVLRLNQDIQNLPNFVVGQEQLNNFNNAVLNTQIILKDKLFWNNQEVTAINYPKLNPPMIELSKSRWQQLQTSKNFEEVIYKLILHEYLPISGLADDKYEISEYIWSWTQFLLQKQLYDFLVKYDATYCFDSSEKIKVITNYLKARSLKYFNDYSRAMHFTIQNENLIKMNGWFELFKIIFDQVPNEKYSYDYYIIKTFYSLKQNTSEQAQQAVEYMKSKGLCKTAACPELSN